MTTETLTMRSKRRRRRAAAAVACVLTVGLGVGASQAQAALRSSDASRSPVAAQALNVQPPAPSVHLRTSGVDLGVTPYSACWSGPHNGYCYDGVPPQPLPSLGGTGSAITITFPRDGWHFRVDLTDGSGHHSRVPVRQVDDRLWRVVTGDLAKGGYRADLFGRGPQGDVLASATFTLT